MESPRTAAPQSRRPWPSSLTTAEKNLRMEGWAPERPPRAQTRRAAPRAWPQLAGTAQTRLRRQRLTPRCHPASKPKKRRKSYRSFLPEKSGYPDIGFPLFPLSKGFIKSIRGVLTQFRAALLEAGMPESTEDK